MKQLLNARLNINLLKDTLGKNRNFFVIITVLLCLTYPVPLLLEIYYSGATNMQWIEYELVALLFIATAGLLMITPFIFFNYLTKKRSVDFMHSLPISRSSLFLTYALASILLVLIPFTITYWFGNIVTYIFYSNQFELFHLVVYFRALLLFGSIQIPTIFVIMNTGTLSDSVIFTMILFVAPFVAYFAISAFTSLYLLGFSNISSSNILLYISPLTVFISSVVKDGGPDNINLLTLYWIIGSLIMYILSCSAYRKWKSEYSERPFNNDYFYPFVISLFTALLFMFMISIFSVDYNANLKFLSPVNLVFPILITYVVYVLIDFMKHRTTKYYFKATKHFILIIIFSLSITTIVYSTQGFGYAWKIPEVTEVESINISSEQYFNEYSRFDVRISDKKDIESVIQIHQQLVNEFKEANSFFNNDIQLGNDEGVLKIQYNLGGKSKLKRNFSIPRELADTLSRLQNINGIIQESHPLLKNKEVSNTNIYSTLDQSMLKFNETQQADFIKAYLDDLTRIQDTNIDVVDRTVTHIIRYEALKEEISNDEPNYYGESYQLLVDERFTKTLNVLSNVASAEVDFDAYQISNEYQNNASKNFFHTPWTYTINPQEDQKLSEQELKKYSSETYLFSETRQIVTFIAITIKDSDQILFVIPIFA